jgi:hypothetical protein
MSISHIFKALLLIVAFSSPATATPNAWVGTRSSRVEWEQQRYCQYNTPTGGTVEVTAVFEGNKIPSWYLKKYPDTKATGLVLGLLDGGQVSCNKSQPQAFSLPPL